jgi:hypothetical protein
MSDLKAILPGGCILIDVNSTFTDQNGRVRRIVEAALAGGSVFEASHSEENGRHVVIEARRSGGQGVGLRFRGVQKSTMSSEPEEGALLRLRGVGAPGITLLRVLIPGMRNVSGGYVRVRIEAGAAMLDIVCQDAEWWERAPGETRVE